MTANCGGGELAGHTVTRLVHPGSAGSVAPASIPLGSLLTAMSPNLGAIRVQAFAGMVLTYKTRR
jgi:hypothetical protein